MNGRKLKVKPGYVAGAVAVVVGLIILVLVIAIPKRDSKEQVQTGSTGSNGTNESGGTTGTNESGGGKGGEKPKTKTCAEKVADFEAFMDSGATEEKVREEYEKRRLECPTEFALVNLMRHGDDRNANGSNPGCTGEVNDQTGPANINNQAVTANSPSRTATNQAGTANNQSGASNSQSSDSDQSGTANRQSSDSDRSGTASETNQSGTLDSGNPPEQKKINFASLSPTQVKTLRLQFFREINQRDKDPKGPLKQGLKPLCEFLFEGSVSDLLMYYHIQDYEDSMKILSDGELFIKEYYNWSAFFPEFVKAEIIKATKVGNGGLAQKYYNLYHATYVVPKYYEKSVVNTDPFQPLQTNTVDDLNDFKFWDAIFKSNWTTANQLLDQAIKQLDHAIQVEDKNIKSLDKKLYLPKFLCQELIDDINKLKLLQELSPDQMDALMDFKRMDEIRQEALNSFLSSTGCEETLKKHAAEYEKVFEQMNLLKADIHPNFKIKVPTLPKVKTKLHEIREYCENNSVGFEVALEKLEKDPKRSLPTIFEVIYSVNVQEHRLQLFDDFIKMKSDMKGSNVNWTVNKFDCDFLKLLKNVEEGRFEEFSTAMKEYLTEYSEENKDEKVLILKSNERAFQIFGQFYRKQVSLNKNVHQAQIFACFADFWSVLLSHLPRVYSINRYSNVNPFQIESVGQLGFEELVPKSVQLIKAWSERPNASDEDKIEYQYALDYVKVFDAMKGKDMYKLWQSSEDQPKEYFTSVPPQVAKTLFENKKKLVQFRKSYFDEKMPEKVIEYVNSPITTKLRNLRNSIEISDMNLKYYYNLENALNSSELTNNDIEAFLKSRAIDQLRTDLESVFYIYWKDDSEISPLDIGLIKAQFTKFKDKPTQAEFEILWNYSTQYILNAKNEYFRKVTDQE